MGLDSAQFTQGLDKATKDARRFAKEQDRIAKEGAANFKAFSTGVLSAGAALVAVAVTAFRHADQIVDLAKAYDASVESVVALNKAFTVTGGNAESSQKILGKLTQTANEAAEGNDKLRKTFSDIGISAKEVLNLTPDQLLVRVAEGLKDIENPTLRNAIAFELLGKAAKGIDWKSFADEYDRVADPELAKNIEDAAKAWDNVQVAIKNIFELVIKLLQPLATAINYITDLPKKIRELKISGGTTQIPDGFGGFVEVESAPDQKAIAARDQKIAEQKATRDAKKREIESKAGGYKASAEDRALQAARQQMRINEELFQIETARLGLESQRAYLSEAAFKRRTEELNLEQKIAQLTQQIATTEKTRTDVNSGSVNQTIKNIEAQIESEKKLSAQRIANINQDVENQKDFNFGWDQAFKQYSEQAANAADLGADAFRTFTSSIDSAIDQFVETGTFKFKNFFRDIVQELLKSGIKKQFAVLFSTLGQASGGSGFFSNILSSAGALFGGGKAAGGPVTPGTYLIGERGPELFTTPAGGYISPTSTVQGMNSKPVQNYITYDIKAIDAQSFVQLLSQHPTVIHGLASEGARRAGVGSFS